MSYSEWSLGIRARVDARSRLPRAHFYLCIIYIYSFHLISGPRRNYLHFTLLSSEKTNQQKNHSCFDVFAILSRS